MAVNTTTQVTLPAMGESVREGTVLEWHKREGEAVSAGETLVEISTDKVDAELPAPTAGTITEILAAPGETVMVGQVIARMRAGATSNGAASSSRPAAADTAGPDLSGPPAPATGNGSASSGAAAPAHDA